MMEWKCTGKGIVIRMNLIFGFFGYKTRGICVYNKTAEKQGSFSSYNVWDITTSHVNWCENNSMGAGVFWWMWMDCNHSTQ